MVPHYPKMSRKQTNYMNYMYIYTYICYCCSVTKYCSIHCDPMNCSPPGSSVHGISQARILEWVAISFSNTYRNTYNIYTITLWSCRSQIQRVKSKGRNRVKRPLQLSKWEVLNAWFSGAARTIEMRKWMRVLFEKKTDLTLMIIKSLCFISALVPVYHLEHVYSISSCGN